MDDRKALLDRIKQLEVGLRRAIHLIEKQRSYVLWPMDYDDDPTDGTIRDEEWASITLELCKDALKGKEDG